MSVEPRIRLGDQLAIKALFASARFIAAGQENRPPLRIEGKGHAPDAIRGVKPEFFHVGVTRTIERIGARPPQLRSELLKQPGVGQQFVLDALRQALELMLEFLMEHDFPWHVVSMQRNTYVVKYIFSKIVGLPPVTGNRDLCTCRRSLRCDITGIEERVVVPLLRPRPVRRPEKLFQKQLSGASGRLSVWIGCAPNPPCLFINVLANSTEGLISRWQPEFRRKSFLMFYKHISHYGSIICEYFFAKSLILHTARMGEGHRLYNDRNPRYPGQVNRRHGL